MQAIIILQKKRIFPDPLKRLYTVMDWLLDAFILDLSLLDTVQSVDLFM